MGNNFGYPNISSDFVFEEDATAFAESLLSTPVVVHPHGLEETKLSMAFGFSKKADPRLITRINSRAVYTAVYQSIVAGVNNKFVVEGAPGIGKSRNLAYLLKLLLQANKTVLYHAVERSIMYLFLPPTAANDIHESTLPAKRYFTRTDRYRCYSYDGPGTYAKLRAFTRDPSVVLLYDPPKENAEPPQVDCSTVIAASPNDRHFRNFLHDRTAKLYKINAPTIEEVLAFFHVFAPAATTTGNAPAAGVPTYNTPVGPIPEIEADLPLSDDHLRVAYREVDRFSS